MARNNLSAERRAQLARHMVAVTKARIAAGELPPDHYARAGHKGYLVTLQKCGPARMAEILSAFYGVAIDPAALQRNLARERERSATARAYPGPLDGWPCACCGAPAQARHHTRGWEAGHAPGLILLVCRPCHRALDLARVRAGGYEPCGGALEERAAR